MAPAGPEYRAFSARRATEIRVPPSVKSGRKTVAKLSDWARRSLHTHPHRTNSKLRQTRRIRQAVVPESESNTKGSSTVWTAGTTGTTQVATAEVSDRSTRFRKSLSSTIFVSRCHKSTVNPRYPIFLVENARLDGRQRVCRKSRESAILLGGTLHGSWRARSDSQARSKVCTVL